MKRNILSVLLSVVLLVAPSLSSSPAPAAAPIGPVLFSFGAAIASYTSLFGAFVNPQGVPVTGKLILTLPFAGLTTTEGAYVSPRPITFPLYQGQIVGYSQIIPNADILPAKTYYVASLYDQYGSLVESRNIFIPLGVSFNMGLAIQTAVTTGNISYMNPANLSGNNTFTGNNIFSASTIFNSAVTFNSSIVVNGTITCTSAFATICGGVGTPTIIGNNSGGGTGAAGSCGTSVCIDRGGVINVLTGAGPATNSTIVFVNFGVGTYSGSFCTIIPGNLSAAGGSVGNWYVVSGPTQFTINSGSVALAAGVTYTWVYNCGFR